MKQQDSTKNYPDTVWSKNFNQQNKKMKDLCTCGKDPLLVSMYSTYCMTCMVWFLYDARIISVMNPEF